MIFISASGRISVSQGASNLLSPSVVSVSKFALELDIDNSANFETTTLASRLLQLLVRPGLLAIGVGQAEFLGQSRADGRGGIAEAAADKGEDLRQLIVAQRLAQGRHLADGAILAVQQHAQWHVGTAGNDLGARQRWGDARRALALVLVAAGTI